MALAATPSASTAPQRFKYRLRFGKQGDLRLVSHHDLMHCCERLFRRAGLPISLTQGFHPGPRMTFAQSLALGLGGANEVLEIELAREFEAQDVLAALRQHAPPGLVFHQARAVPLRSSAQPRRAFYRLAVPAFESDWSERFQHLLDQKELWVNRSRPQPRRVNIRPFLDRLRVVPPEGGNAASLEVVLWVTPQGTGRPEEVLRLLGLEHLLDGATLERFDLELTDEVEASAALAPVIHPRELTAPWRGETAGPPEPAPASNAHALIDGPMSYES